MDLQNVELVCSDGIFLSTRTCFRISEHGSSEDGVFSFCFSSWVTVNFSITLHKTTLLVKSKLHYFYNSPC